MLTLQQQRPRPKGSALCTVECLQVAYTKDTLLTTVKPIHDPPPQSPWRQPYSKYCFMHPDLACLCQSHLQQNDRSTSPHLRQPCSLCASGCMRSTGAQQIFKFQTIFLKFDVVFFVYHRTRRMRATLQKRQNTINGRSPASVVFFFPSTVLDSLDETVTLTVTSFCW